MNDLDVLKKYLTGELTHELINKTLRILRANGFEDDLSLDGWSLEELVEHCIFDLTV